ncbi:hypothetical protein SBRCBS47491_009089 [Sporothrix bragantina]|uniref:Aminoglycoside phosphotransferase domain-containing protein n=1 Tax=Sporothrix bragantina TaxID=671064 RepID=A0ABP0CSG4_9PEZI
MSKSNDTKAPILIAPGTYPEPPPGMVAVPVAALSGRQQNMMQHTGQQIGVMGGMVAGGGGDMVTGAVVGGFVGQQIGQMQRHAAMHDPAAPMAFVDENSRAGRRALYACFEDDAAAYVITEYVEGVGMNELTADEQKTVVQELEQHLKTLKTLTSNVWGGPGGSRMRPREKHDLVFCHNDLSAHNVIVDPATLKINAIIDWEYAGFFPPEFEMPIYLRVGPSVALPGETDDTDVLTNMMNEEKL